MGRLSMFKSPGKGENGIMQQGGWKNVALPDAMFNFLPFDIQTNGASFRVDPLFDLETFANITITKTYYVDKATGNDGNTGLSWAQAFATVKQAYDTGDYDRIYVKPGYYYRNQSLAGPARAHKLIGVGEGVYITRDHGNEIGAFTQTNNHYSATISGGYVTARVYDHSNLDSFGGDTKLTLMASEAEVEATVNSWFQSGTTIYIHTFDGRAPDSDLRYNSSGTAWFNNSDVSTYVENIRFLGGGVQARNASAAGGSKLFCKNVWGMDYIIAGVDIAIFQNCKSFQTNDDGWNYDVRNAVVSKIVEIDCEGYHGGTTTSHQATTLHNNCLCVSINGKYHDMTAQIVSDTGYRWMLGSEIYNSATNIGVRNSAGACWLDTCNIHDNTTSLQTGGASAAIHHRNLTGSGSFDTVSGGTIDTY